MKMDDSTNTNTNNENRMKLSDISIDDIYEVSEILQCDFSELHEKFVFNKNNYIKASCLWRCKDINKFLEGVCVYNEDEILNINCLEDKDVNYDYLIRNLPKTVKKIELVENRYELIKALQKNKFKVKKTITKNTTDFFLMEKV